MSATTHGTRLDPWYGAYAARTLGMKASETRALFAVANRPEVVSLAGGMPFLAALPMDLVAKVTADLIATEGTVALQYGNGQGDPKLREQIVEVMAEEAMAPHPDDIVITTGSQQALDLVTRIFCDPGDVVLAEGPSYVGALGVFRAYEADVVHVPMDAHGLVPQALREALAACKAAGRTVKFLYLIPNFHNPAGVRLPMARREEILAICQSAGVLVVEDNAYGLLAFDGSVIPAIHSLDSEGVLYLGTFSKMLAPGYRTGWVSAPHAVRERLVLASESAILCPSHYSQYSIATYLSAFDWRQQVADYQKAYRLRCETMVDALNEYLPECSWNIPEGGFYIWTKAPPGIDTKAMLPRAVTGLVAYVAGTGFYADGQGGDHMRLSFCFPTPERIREGVRRLSVVVRRELELLEMFGSAARIDPERPHTSPDVDVPAPDLA